ncbi:hypothetical protein AB7C35_03465 [Bacillus subtilis]|uniref:hypothetical protein n=1 Tax=Bacillus subtilis TaxID=1423 RepID=UPI003515E049
MVEGENKMHILYYDENFLYAGEDFIETDELPPQSTLTIPDPSIILPKYNPEKDEWFESATEEYKDSVKPGIPEPSDMEKMKQQLADLTFQLMMGGFV